MPGNQEAEQSVLGAMLPPTEEPEQVADQAEELIYAVARRDQRDEVVLVRPVIDQTMEELEHIHERESAYSGVPSGFRDLDELLSGLQKGNLIVVAARPGVGKSSLVTNLIRNVTVEGTPAALFSLEMSRWEIGMRLLCGEARVPWDRVRAARVSGDDWSRIAARTSGRSAPIFERASRAKRWCRWPTARAGLSASWSGRSRTCSRSTPTGESSRRGRRSCGGWEFAPSTGSGSPPAGRCARP